MISKLEMISWIAPKINTTGRKTHKIIKCKYFENKHEFSRTEHSSCELIRATYYVLNGEREKKKKLHIKHKQMPTFGRFSVASDDEIFLFLPENVENIWVITKMVA